MLGFCFLIFGMLLGGGSIFAFLCKPSIQDMYFVCALVIAAALFCCSGAIIMTLEKLDRRFSPDDNRLL